MAHHIAEDGELEEVRQLQLFAHTLFAKYEPSLLKILNRMIETDFFRGRGRPILISDPEICYGCGLCVSTCSSEARRLVERIDYSNMYYPINLVRRFGAEGAGKGQTAFGQD